MTRRILWTLATASLGFSAALAADAPAPGIDKIVDGQIRTIEREVVSLAEAMPADKYNFAPTQGEFKGVRTFSQQMTHIAAVVYVVSAASMGVKNPSDPGPDENGPASIHGKEAVVKYLKDAFAFAHKAAGELTSANMLDMMPSPFGQGKMPRIQAITMVAWHSFDHYGQSVEYARMNGIVPPASQPQPKR